MRLSADERSDELEVSSSSDTTTTTARGLENPPTSANLTLHIATGSFIDIAELKLRHSYTEKVQKKRRQTEEKRLLLQRNELLDAIRRGLQADNPAGDADSSEGGPTPLPWGGSEGPADLRSWRNSATPSLPPGPPSSSSSGPSSRSPTPPPSPSAEIDQRRLLAEHTATEASDGLQETATLLADDTGTELAVIATSPVPELTEPFVPFGAKVAYASVAHSQQAASQLEEASPLERQWSGSEAAAPLPLVAYALPVAPAGATWLPNPFPAPPRFTSFVPSRRPATPTSSEKGLYSNPYVIFCQEQRPFLPTGLRNAERERYLGRMWKALSEEEKARYKGRTVKAPDPAPSMEPAVRQSSGPLTTGQPAAAASGSASSSSSSSSSSSIYNYATPISWPVSSLPSPPPSSLPSATLLALAPIHSAAPSSFVREPTGTPLMRAPSTLMNVTAGKELQLAELLELMTEEEAMEVVEQDALEML